MPLTDMLWGVINGGMDLNEKITLYQGTPEGQLSIELPLINILRISMQKLNDLKNEFIVETKSNNLNEFWEWMSVRLETKGKTVLM
jgi:hypothetical protein